MKKQQTKGHIDGVKKEFKSHKIKEEGARSKRQDPIHEVTFRPKASWQKEDCINRSAEYDCKNESTVEAVYGKAAVRCCIDKRCMKRAGEIALAIGKN